MLTTRIAGTTAAFIVIVGMADGAAAQTTTTATTAAKSVSAETALPAPAPSAPRPLALSLYGSFIALEGLDVHSTLKGMQSGRTTEANPLLGSMASSPPMLIAFKAGTAAGIIALCEQMRKDGHGKAAVFVMIGLNSAYAMVVAHNYQLLRQ
jgi:hypothetical protein